MARVVLDSSAFLAMSLREPGAERVLAVLERSVLSSVNATEIIGKLILDGMTPRSAESYVIKFVSEVVPHDWDLAVRAAELVTVTRSLGLSLGDRACLALGQKLDLPVLTADQAWSKLEIGVRIELIRENSDQ